MQTTKRIRGFTLIEIVLVIAIAGLIFMVLFIALPAVQRSIRDNQRRQAADNLLAQLEVFRSQHGHYPLSAAEQAKFSSSYKVDFTDPTTGNTYSAKYSSVLFSTHTDAPPPGEIIYTTAHWCSSNLSNHVDGDDTNHSIVVVIVRLEIGNFYCNDNYLKQ